MPVSLSQTSVLPLSWERPAAGLPSRLPCCQDPLEATSVNTDRGYSSVILASEPFPWLPHCLDCCLPPQVYLLTSFPYLPLRANVISCKTLSLSPWAICDQGCFKAPGHLLITPSLVLWMVFVMHTPCPLQITHERVSNEWVKGWIFNSDSLTRSEGIKSRHCEVTTNQSDLNDSICLGAQITVLATSQTPPSYVTLSRPFNF